MKDEIDKFWEEMKEYNSRGDKAKMTKFKNYLVKHSDAESMAKIITVYWFQGYDECIEVVGRKVSNEIDKTTKE